jgi:hypothetical protein
MTLIGRLGHIRARQFLPATRHIRPGEAHLIGINKLK